MKYLLELSCTAAILLTFTIAIQGAPVPVSPAPLPPNDEKVNPPQGPSEGLPQAQPQDPQDDQPQEPEEDQPQEPQDGQPQEPEEEQPQEPQDGQPQQAPNEGQGFDLINETWDGIYIDEQLPGLPDEKPEDMEEWGGEEDGASPRTFLLLPLIISDLLYAG